MLIIQGRNDPRVLEIESREATEYLKTNGTEVELLVFEDEGHDVMKFKNKVICYTKIRLLQETPEPLNRTKKQTLAPHLENARAELFETEEECRIRKRLLLHGY